MLFVDDVTHLLFVVLDGGGTFHFMRGYSCVCSLVQNLSNLATSSMQVSCKFLASFLQVSCKFLASFVLKLVSEREWIVFMYAQIFLCM